jgi:hypothetical protein
VTVDEYQVLTGEPVPTSNYQQLEAQLLRTQRTLERMLGYSLDSEEIDTNLYDESGKVTSSDWPCWTWNTKEGYYDDFIWGGNNQSALDTPDDVEFAYRVFPYRPNDRFLHLDPFKEIYSIKLIRNNVTLRTITPENIRVRRGRQPWARYVDIGAGCSWWGYCSCHAHQLQVAVDAYWEFEEVPEELKYIWADMVYYNLNPKSEIRSESIGAHSYTRFDNTRPQDMPSNLEALQQYAGPRGSIVRTLTL